MAQGGAAAALSSEGSGEAEGGGQGSLYATLSYRHRLDIKAQPVTASARPWAPPPPHPLLFIMFSKALATSSTVRLFRDTLFSLPNSAGKTGGGGWGCQGGALGVLFCCQGQAKALLEASPSPQLRLPPPPSCHTSCSLPPSP